MLGFGELHAVFGQFERPIYGLFGLLGLLLMVLLYAVGAVVLYFVVKMAVKAALKEHEKEK